MESHPPREVRAPTENRDKPKRRVRRPDRLNRLAQWATIVGAVCAVIMLLLAILK
jgi:hypothetical protein